MRLPVTALVLAATVSACGGSDDSSPAPEPEARIELTSPELRAGGRLERAATCDGVGRAPAFEWSGVPEGTRELALVLEDPDAPDGTFIHWTVWGLDPAAGTLFGEGPVEGKASSGKRGYEPPCPPEGDGPHSYRFVLHALDRKLQLKAGASPEAVGEAVRRLSLARGVLSGTYER